MADDGVLGPIIAAPSVLPATGATSAVPASGPSPDPVAPDVRIGDLGDMLGGPAAVPGTNARGGARAWSITPSMTVSEEYTSGGQAGLRNQFITMLQPSLLASGDTTRLRGDLSYTPEIEVYSSDGDQNQIDQNFNGRLLATLVPQTLFLDLRGSGTVQAITPGVGPAQRTTLARGNTSQTLTFSASPYAVHRFGTWGTGELGGFFARTTQSALQPATDQAVLAALAEASNQNVTTTGGHVAFATGEAFARYNATALAQTSNFAGTGVLDGAYRDTATLDSGYAITRRITALATVGWESIHYAGTAPVRIDDAVWNVGFRLEPNAASSITVRYGHQDGLNSVVVDASYQATERTKLFARYSTGLTTQAEQLQNALASSDLDALGDPVDHATGAPLLPIGNFFGTQNSLFKTTLASLTAQLTLNRDVVSASVVSQNQTLISASNAVGLASGDSSGIYGSVTWSHELSESMRSTLYAQYGTQRTDGLFGNTQQLVVASAALTYALSPTLFGQLQYSYTQTFGGNSIASGISGGPQSLVLLSLTKTF